MLVSVFLGAALVSVFLGAECFCVSVCVPRSCASVLVSVFLGAECFCVSVCLYSIMVNMCCFQMCFINPSVVVVVWYDCSSVRHYLHPQHLSGCDELPQGHGRPVLLGDPLQRGQSLVLVPRQDVVASALREPL